MTTYHRAHFEIPHILNLVLFFQTAILEIAAKHHQQELQHSGVLQAVAGPGRRNQVPDGAEGPVRQGHRRPVSTTLRHQGLLHCPVRTHTHPASHLQGGRLSRGRLLGGCM